MTGTNLSKEIAQKIEDIPEPETLEAASFIRSQLIQWKMELLDSMRSIGAQIDHAREKEKSGVRSEDSWYIRAKDARRHIRSQVQKIDAKLAEVNQKRSEIGREHERTRLQSAPGSRAAKRLKREQERAQASDVAAGLVEGRVGADALEQLPGGLRGHVRQRLLCALVVETRGMLQEGTPSEERLKEMSRLIKLIDAAQPGWAESLLLSESE